MSKAKRRRPLTPAEKQNRKEFVSSMLPRVFVQDVVLKEGKLNQKKEQYWHVYYSFKRVGKVFIKESQEKPMITVEINQHSQGIGIGRATFRKACELSQFDKVYALIRKNNVSSIKAIKFAGFKEVGTENGQILYRWERKGTRIG
jgi:RimJ/RimL family protein N-acetyltransferase